MQECIQNITYELMRLEELGAEMAVQLKEAGDEERKDIADRIKEDWERTKEGPQPNPRTVLVLYYRMKGSYHELSWLRMRPMKDGRFRTMYISKGAGLRYTRQSLSIHARPFEKKVIQRMEDDAATIRGMWAAATEVRRVLREFPRGLTAIERRHAKAGLPEMVPAGAAPDQPVPEPEHDNSFYLVDPQTTDSQGYPVG